MTSAIQRATVRTSSTPKPRVVTAGVPIRMPLVIAGHGFEEDRVRAYLDQRGVAYVDNQAATSLIVPVAASNVNAADWGGQWVIRSASGVTGKSDESSLAPYVGSTQTWTQRPTTNDIQAELTRTRTEGSSQSLMK